MPFFGKAAIQKPRLHRASPRLSTGLRPGSAPFSRVHCRSFAENNCATFRLNGHKILIRQTPRPLCEAATRAAVCAQTRQTTIPFTARQHFLMRLDKPCSAAAHLKNRPPRAGRKGWRHKAVKNAAFAGKTGLHGKIYHS